MKIEVPPELKAYAELGFEFSSKSGSTHLATDCPYCGKEKHFFCHRETGQFKCHVCGESGNRYSFLEHMVEQSREAIPADKWHAFCRDRGVPQPAFLSWKIGFNQITDEWLIPQYNEQGKLANVLRWRGPVEKGQPKAKLFSTSGCKKQLFGVRELIEAPKHSVVWVCAGEWDAIALRWLLRSIGRKDVVVAVPGESIFKEEWLEWFDGHEVRLCYDADEAGDKGSMRASIALHARGQARRVSFLRWPLDAPKGFDLRDYIKNGRFKHKVTNQEILASLEERLGPEHRLGTNAAEQLGLEGGSTDSVGMTPPSHIPTWSELLAEFSKRLSMDRDMRWGLTLCLATVVSVDIAKDPIWCYLISPPGGGKTTLLDTLRKTQRAVFRSSLTPASLVSGFNAAKDPSLLPKLTGKCGVFKDGTELIAMHPVAKNEIMAILRGAYDGDVDRSYGNGVVRTYRHLNFTLIIGITNVISGESMSSVGERFLKFSLQRNAEDANAQLWAAVRGIDGADERANELQDLVSAFLWRKITDEPGLPVIAEKEQAQLIALAQTVSRLRARPDYEQGGGERILKYRPVPEIATRLAKQITKLAKCVGWVWGCKKVDNRVMEMVRRVGFDTAEGFQLELIAALAELDREKEGLGVPLQDLAVHLRLAYEGLRRTLHDAEALQLVEKVETAARKGSKGGRPIVKWRLSEEMRHLWDAMGGGVEWEKEAALRRAARKIYVKE